MMLVCGPSLLQGSASLPRSYKGSLGLRMGALMLQVPKVDGNLQLTPLACQAEVFRLKVRVDISKLRPKKA